MSEFCENQAFQSQDNFNHSSRNYGYIVLSFSNMRRKIDWNSFPFWVLIVLSLGESQPEIHSQENADRDRLVQRHARLPGQDCS